MLAGKDWKDFQSCSIQQSNFLNIFGADVATAHQVLLMQALDGLAVHYLPIVSGTNFRRNLKITSVVLLYFLCAFVDCIMGNIIFSRWLYTIGER
jgi:hypothetical protein